ncbi:MAG: hypothetical protein GDA67_16760 [Nitrospira sp. CR1.3]|nr:hypothetical protein [Nitrospira sp. CR1.3]
MTLNITLQTDTETKLRERAQAEGEDVDSYAARLLEDAVSAPSIDDLLAPFRREVDESGMSDAQLDEFYADLRTKSVDGRRPDKAHRP